MSIKILLTEPDVIFVDKIKPIVHKLLKQILFYTLFLYSGTLQLIQHES